MVHQSNFLGSMFWVSCLLFFFCFSLVCVGSFGPSFGVCVATVVVFCFSFWFLVFVLLLFGGLPSLVVVKLRVGCGGKLQWCLFIVTALWFRCHPPNFHHRSNMFLTGFFTAFSLCFILGFSSFRDIFRRVRSW